MSKTNGVSGQHYRHLLAQLGRDLFATEPPLQLEEPKHTPGAVREHLPIQHQQADPDRSRHLDQLRHAIGDVVKAAGEDTHVGSEDMDLHARTVEFPVDRGW